MALNQYNYDDNNYMADDEQARLDEEQRRFAQPSEVQQAAEKSTPGYQAPASPTQTWNRETFKNAGMSRPAGQSVADFVNQNGWNPFVQFVPGSQDKVILPSEGGRTQEVIDMAINSNNGVGGNGWTDAGSWINGQVVARGMEPGAAPTGDRPVLNASTPQTIVDTELQAKQAADAALRQQLIDKLMARSNQSLAIDRNDPTIRAQADAYSANEERAKRNYLADLAEKAGPLANLRGEQRLAAERVGQRTGSFEADLMGRELMAKRAEIAQALEQMQGLIGTGQEMALREKLALMDDAIARMKLQQDASQFGSDLDYRNRSLAEQSRQYNDTLGFNYDQFDWERSPMNPRNIMSA